MKDIYRSLLLIVVVLFSFQCKDKSPQDIELDKLFDEVMALHDDVMPKTATIHRLKKKLKKDIEGNNRVAMNTAIEQLDIADEGMMQWMADFKKPKNKSFEEAKTYLNGEKAKIIKVKRDILSAISVAEELIPKAE